MATVNRKPYTGTRSKLVVAFDVGTTFSGASYSILEPGQPPEIRPVTQFPGQQTVGGDSKIPSIVCYDADGRVVAVGSETDPDNNPELSEVVGLSRAEWFKMYLRPPRLAAEQGFDTRKLPPLPRNKTAIDVFGDVLHYLFDATKRYIQERQGVDLWNSVEDDIHFILSHPNGWEGRQQADMRHAAVTAGLVANEVQAAERVSFVTEGEASLHFCLNKIPQALEGFTAEGVMVVDCGGGTIDISSYTRASDRTLKEISPAQCLLQGSIFVTQRATDYLTGHLQGSKYGGAEEIATMTRFFDKKTKPGFKNVSKLSFIRFGRTSDNDDAFDIKAGALKLSGAQVASFFEPSLKGKPSVNGGPSVKGIIDVIEEQCSQTTIPVKAICLVGGFSTSDYLFSRLDGHFRGRDIQILRPDAYLNKAVADGAVSYHIDHRVSVRVSKFTFGIEATRLFDPMNPDHVCRPDLVHASASGQRRIEGIFSEILAKATAVSEEKEFRKTYFHELPRDQFEEFNSVELVLMCYRGRAAKAPQWLDLEQDFFEDNCEVFADLASLKRHLKPLRNGGKEYFRFEMDVVLLFGLTELKAFIAWKEDGVEKQGPASIVYDTTMSNDG